MEAGGSDQTNGRGAEPFGYKMAWMAIPTRDSNTVISALSLEDPVKVSWSEGVNAAYLKNSICGNACRFAMGYGCMHRVFVCPAIGDWTLVLSFDLFGHVKTAADAQEIAEYMIRLSKTLGEVQYFGTSRTADWHQWLLARNGALVRSFGFCPEWTEPFWNSGQPTSAEKFDFESFMERRYDFDSWSPDESSVMEVAHGWSIDPTQLDEQTETKSNGYACIIGRDPRLLWNIQHERFLDRVAKPKQPKFWNQLRRFFGAQ